MLIFKYFWVHNQQITFAIDFSLAHSSYSNTLVFFQYYESIRTLLGYSILLKKNRRLRYLIKKKLIIKDQNNKNYQCPRKFVHDLVQEFMYNSLKRIFFNEQLRDESMIHISGPGNSLLILYLLRFIVCKRRKRDLYYSNNINGYIIISYTNCLISPLFFRSW